jgi:nitrate/nitrite-specific signal transduction histidine kinase
MKARAKELNAKFDIESQKGKGTCVSLFSKFHFRGHLKTNNA